MKDCSNLPSPDTCPLTKVIKMVFRANLNKEKLQLFSFIFFVRLQGKYVAKCEFDANVFRHASKPGFYMVQANLLNNNEIKTGIVVRGSVSEK